MNDRAIKDEDEVYEVELKESDIVLPVSIEGMQKAWDRFQQVKKALLSSDIVKYNKNGWIAQSGEEGKDYIVKSGWRKIATAFNLSIDMSVGESKKIYGEDGEGKYYTWLFPVRAIAPNGKYQDSIGACSSRKAFFSKKNKQRIDPQEEDIILMAQTVGINRAISDLVGGGEVSGEEMIGKQYITSEQPKAIDTTTQPAFDRSKLNPDAKPKTKINPKTNKEYCPTIARLYSISSKVYGMEIDDFHKLCIDITGKEHSKDYTNQDCWNIEDEMKKFNEKEVDKILDDNKFEMDKSEFADIETADDEELKMITDVFPGTVESEISKSKKHIKEVLK
jgi:hypothetical protein